MDIKFHQDKISDMLNALTANVHAAKLSQVASEQAANNKSNNNNNSGNPIKALNGSSLNNLISSHINSNNSSNNNNNNNNLNVGQNQDQESNGSNQNQMSQQFQQQVDSIEANKGYTFEEQFKQLYELSDDPKRKEFLDDLFQFMADRNQPVNRIPIMAKQVLDLYELYNLVVARGGLVEVINKKIWREITKGLNLPSSITSAAFTLRTQYMKYLYPYECAKNNFSHQDELQQAIDGNRRESRRAGSTGLAGAYGAYMGQAGGGNQLDSSGRYSASPSPPPPPTHHLFASHNLLAAAAAAGHLTHNHPLNPSSLISAANQSGVAGDQQNHSGGSSNASPSSNFAHHLTHHLSQASQQLQQQQQQQQQQNQQQQQRKEQANHYQDSIESDRDEDDDGTSIDLSHSPKRSSPGIVGDSHMDVVGHNDNHQMHQQSAADHHQQQYAAAAAAAAALRQQLGAAMNFPGVQNLFCQLAAGGQVTANQPGIPQPTSQVQPQPATNAASQAVAQNAQLNNGNQASATTGGGPELMKQQQEQFLAALMAAAAASQQQQQQQQQQSASQTRPAQQQPAANGFSNLNNTINSNNNQSTDQQQQAAARAALSGMAPNAMILNASNVPDAMAVATAAQAIGVKGAFIILLL